METFTIEMELDVAAASVDEAEEIVREILEAEPVISEFRFGSFTKQDVVAGV